ncbi:diacylglycerol O-acyltransferase 1-like [Forsythia ovata]|uniref:Diacylglycerol O-acyltransferase 1-like n=1 Tax=Forsythia ovata TaxID=205694 RepID=A0ABD1PV30_9LAMI
MAILELPESVETTTSNTHHSRAASTVRWRSSAVAVLESKSNSLETVTDSDGDVNNNNGMGNLCGGVVDLVREKPSESGTEGLSNGKEEEVFGEILVPAIGAGSPQKGLWGWVDNF